MQDPDKKTHVSRACPFKYFQSYAPNYGENMTAKTTLATLFEKT